MSVVEHYAVLGLSPGAPMAQVKAQFRHLAMDAHPDRNANDRECQERLTRLNAAYEFLSDASRKAAYDAGYFARALSEPAPTAPARILTQTSFPLRLIGAYLLLVGFVVAAVVLIGSVQSADSPVHAPALTVIELSPTGAGAPASHQDGTSFDATPLNATPLTGGQINGVPAQSSQGQPLWSGDPVGASSAPTAAGIVPPASDAAPPVMGAWPSSTSVPLQ